MKTPWAIVEEHVYEHFRIFSARRSKRINPRTGKPFDFFLMSGYDWVNIIPLTDKNEVVLVRQYRHGIDQSTLEIPGGTVEAGESEPKLTAIRELREETGFIATNAEFLGTLTPNPAMQSMRLHCYLAHGVTKSTQQSLDPGEDIEVITMPLNEVKQAILSGSINHALVVAAFGLYALRSEKWAIT